MPRGDRTGPQGMGSRTGRGLGYCSGSNAPGYASGAGRGLAGRGMRRGGCGPGFGAGFGRGWTALPPAGDAPATDNRRQQRIAQLEAELAELRCQNRQRD
ncbi:MAG: DUF5320 domain-containing protein [Desulfuromonas sp.]|nr:DUF5320 domain-containing protein [Desulfuromonas thiophila]MDY0397046.1 DUF5320 domain-containing protein [Desulfuromonas thiophila]